MEIISLTEKIKSIIKKDIPLISNLSNVSAALKQIEDINWCGFYLYDKNENYLYLGPFQGDVACEIIKVPNGVCGTCVKELKTIIVPDVNKFAGHIACSNLSKSEIVVPIIKNGEIKAVIDIDSPVYNRFTFENKNELEIIANLLSDLF